MNLIRNSGFERGDGTFWEKVDAGTFELSTIHKKYGVYGGKSISGVDTFDYSRNLDYISIEGYEMVKASIWLKAIFDRTLGVAVWSYDGDYSLIGVKRAGRFQTSRDWERHVYQFANDLDSAYIRVGVYIDAPSVGSTFYFDNLLVSRVDLTKTPYGVVSLCSLEDLTASGDTVDYPEYLQGFTNYYAEINVTSMTGTTPTCDVTVCESDSFGHERVLGTFAQFNGVANERIGIDAPIGSGIYAKYVMGGTVTDCDFAVNVIGRR